MVTGIPRGATADDGGPGRGGTGMRSRPGPAGGWTAGRVVTLIIGSVLALISLRLIAGGITLGALSAALIWVPVRLAAGAG